MDGNVLYILLMIIDFILLLLFWNKSTENQAEEENKALEEMLNDDDGNNDEKNEKIKEMLRDLKEKLDAKTREAENLAKENEELKKRPVETKAAPGEDLDELKKKLDEKTQEAQKLAEDKDKLAKDAEKLAQDKDKLAQDNEKLAKENEELKNKPSETNNDANAELEELKKKLNDQGQRLTDLENNNMKLEDENEDLKKQLEDLNAKLQRKNEKIQMIKGHLNEEQKSRLEAEEKAEAERLQREELAAVKDREISEAALRADAAERAVKEAEEKAEAEKRALEEKFEAEKAAWNNQISTVSHQISDLSFGKIRTINHMDLDQLISVHGKSRPIAVYVPCRSSELSHSGAFIYDTHKCPDNSLYLYVGEDCPQPLEALGEKLLATYSNEYPKAEVFHVKRTNKGYEFNKMIKTIGGHIDQIQASVKAGDELFFENNFFKVKLHVVVFSGGNTEAIPVSKSISIDACLPEKGAAIIDCSDTALYLYMSSVMPTDPVEKEDQNRAIKYMTDSPEYSNRDVTIFNKGCIPPNLKLILNQQ